VNEPFIKCPFCAGHEAISPEAADAIGEMIFGWLSITQHPESPIKTELMNIRNSILNHQERAAEVDPLLA
jgi:hypothetical protein